MTSLILLFTLLVSVGATYPEHLHLSESKFIFNGKVDEYIETSNFTWFRDVGDYYYSYHNRGNIISVGAWIKIDHQQDHMVNYLLEIRKLEQIVVVNGTIGYLEWDEDIESPKKSVICPGNYDLTSWNLILIRMIYEGQTLRIDRISIKPLDKLTAFLSLQCREADLKLGMSPQMSTETWIGRRYLGQMTPLFADWLSSENEYQNIENCLETNSIEGCRKRLHRRITRSTTMDHNLDPSMSIRREIDTEVRMVFSSSYSCKDGNVKISLKASQFSIPIPKYLTRHRYYDRRSGYTKYTNVYSYPANVTLGTGDSACNLTWNIDTEELNLADPTPLTSCGFEAKKMNSSTTLFQNSIYVHRVGTMTKLVDLECWYEPPSEHVEEVSVAAYAVQHLLMSVTHSFTSWNITLQLYGDSNFTHKLDNPVMLLKEQDLFVEGNVTYSDVKNVALVMESCITRVSLNPHMTLEKVLIKGSIPMSPDVRYLNSTSSSNKRFVFKATVFEEFPHAMVYLNCVMKAKQITAD